MLDNKEQSLLVEPPHESSRKHDFEYSPHQNLTETIQQVKREQHQQHHQHHQHLQQKEHNHPVHLNNNQINEQQTRIKLPIQTNSLPTQNNPKPMSQGQQQYFPKIANHDKINTPDNERRIQQRVQAIQRNIGYNVPSLKLPSQKEENIPKAPLFNPSYRHSQDSEAQSGYYRNKLFSLMSPQTEQVRRYPKQSHYISQFHQSMNQPKLGLDPFSNMKSAQQYYTSQDQKERMLRSSQGGRWMRSKHIMQNKDHKSIDYLLRHYVKHGSIMMQAINRYISYLPRVQKDLNDMPFRGSLYQPLEAFKTRMEMYLEKKVDLQNLPIDLPHPDWSQQELMHFYTNYKPILFQKMKQISKLKGIILKKYKNCVYFGSMSQGKKNGLGVLHYFSGKIFQGFFQDDYKMEGLQIEDGQLYLGKFRKGLKNGQGILKTDQFLVYGTFTDGQFGLQHVNRQQMNKTMFGIRSPLNYLNSQPVYTQVANRKGFKIDYANLTVFQHDIFISKNVNSDIYIGNVSQKDIKNGQGLQIFSNGDVYIGKYEAGTPDGYGEYYWNSGAFYRGQFLSGMRHGRGKWQMMQGDTYQGEYMNDKKNGRGTYIWKSGVKYVGQFQNDYRHGYGQMFWQDGRVYKGQWINGIEATKSFKIDQHATIGGNGNNSIKHYAKGNTVHINSYGNPSGHSSLPKQSFRTIQTGQHGSRIKREKIPINRLKSIYNPSNHVN